MSSLIRTIALFAAVSAVACGATTSNPGPVTRPPTASGPSTTEPSGPTQVNASERGVIPAGQELDVRLQSTLSSETATVEQRFEATTAADLMQGGRVLVPAGSIVRGVVSSVHAAGRLADRTGSLTLSFDKLVVRGREHTIRGMATQVFESGGILGGLKGAILGAVIGAGGAIAATDGKDITLPAGSIIRIRLDTPVTVST